jgi:hypothetical protein
MKQLYIALLFLLTSVSFSFAQNLQLSPYSEVSIFTMGPGDALFETFGHNAIRVKDPVLQLDIVYNYGTFDFSDPNFYSNFAKGRLEYWLSLSPYKRFEALYRYQKRWMKEQILDLTHQEKQLFFDFLQKNARPENATYLYDPYFDNCSTKIRDISRKILESRIEFSTDYASENLTLRQIMNRELPWNTWGSFGINLSLGSRLDQEMTPDEYMYLPDYLYLAFQNAKKIDNGNSKPLVKEEKLILDFEERPFQIKWYNPLLVFSLLLILTVFITFRDIKKKKRSRITDFLIFFMTGILGVLIVFLWFFTDHKTAPFNFNFLWAFAPNLIVAFFALKKTVPNWLKRYAQVCFGFVILALILWIFRVQLFTPVFLPIFGLLMIRYLFLSGLLTSKE